MSQTVTMFPFEYVMDHDGIEIHCGTMLLQQIPYQDILSAEPGFSILARNWCNLLPFQFITLTVNKGLIRQIVLNPPDRKEFLVEVAERMQAHQFIRNRHLVPA